ncbi:hypothetical protein Kpol_1036p25 [Vanderwaltozyma polyspora DSM 70294]|uniref:Thioredoxin domain-containing protein n=1 Tax=Vanderwaltozyma polyspora (strain ATCC 22028 / DSM 70294 / BCRC 21397 / CBS 2163 / NBRC 10782 / NRRL Y-8283 / UCD 57-17) TaxID=436907 RepID=A7TEH6_VANPO|nr:uncharacterized protein Kpol_1036p25 [Vanderwaltozyma polyspora DSM 70294]EDO19283.1 hypothetical protein Kpol_1036p25 [Vanderwaltozyma polyspora DSM 70294]
MQISRIFWLLILSIFVKLVVSGESHVQDVRSLDQFYEVCNDNSTYTVVKYYTTWCSHCKRLAPVFDKLGEFYDKNIGNDLPVTFLNVDCDVFGNTLCASLPGYPVVQFIKGETPSSDVDGVDPQELSFLGRIVQKITDRFKSPSWQVNPERITEFKGRRDFDGLKNFIETVKGQVKKEHMISTILNDGDCNESELCKIGKAYLHDTLNNISTKKAVDQERMKLENIIKNNKVDEEAEQKALDIVKFKLEFLNYFEDTLNLDFVEERKFVDLKHHDEL